MADITITAANVVPGVGAKFYDGVGGATITAGKAVVRDPTTRKFVLADSNGTAALKKVDGIAVNGASDGQPIRVQYAGEIDLGATLTVGEVYLLSETPGGIQPKADLGTGEETSIIGVGKAANNLVLGLLNSGASVP